MLVKLCITAANDLIINKSTTGPTEGYAAENISFTELKVRIGRQIGRK